MNIPIHIKGAPGRIGSTVPAIPSIKRMIAITKPKGINHNSIITTPQLVLLDDIFVL